MYDHKVEKTQVEQAAWTELNDLLSQLHKKMEYVANTIRCTNCNKRHKRTIVDRPIYAARVCAQCKIHHSVREVVYLLHPNPATRPPPSNRTRPI